MNEQLMKIKDTAAKLGTKYSMHIISVENALRGRKRKTNVSECFQILQFSSQSSPSPPDKLEKKKNIILDIEGKEQEKENPQGTAC